MEEHKELENLVDKLFESDTTESPSMGFTNQVMSQIETLKNVKLEYKPLLPKWAFVLVGIIALFSAWYTLSTNTSSGPELNFLQKIDAGTLISDFMGQFNFSSSLGYSLLGVGIMLCIQAILFKKQLNKRLA